MSQRFSRKDFSLYLVLAAIIILLLLTMYMVDRQWEMMSRIRATAQEQARDLNTIRDEIRALRREIERGVSVDDVTARSQQDNAREYPTFHRAKKSQASEDFAPGDWLVRAFGNGLKTLTPLVSSDAYASRVQSFVFESLLQRDPDSLEWQPHIAESWSVSDDGLTITFELRDEVSFSDGEKLDASDVVFTFDFIMDERIAAPRERAFLEKIASVNAPDNRTVVFTFAEPYFNSLALAGGLEIMPEHFYSPYLKTPQEFNQSKGLLLGSGPYRMLDPAGWTPDMGLVELERNPRYWGPVQPSFERIIWRTIENDSARLTTFRNGEIDVYDARPREYQSLLEDQILRENSNNFDYMSPIVGYSWIGWNQKRGEQQTRFSDQRIRQAMTHLTDRQRIIDEIMLGHAEVALSPFNPRSKQHDVSIEPHEYSVEKALSLLRESGYEDRNNDGVLEDQNGQPFEFELVYFQGNEDTRRIVLLLKDLYAKAGIVLKPVATEWSVMIDLLDRRDFDAITLGWTSGVETDIYQMLHSSQIADGGDNFVNFVSESLDSYIDRARGTVNEQERMALWRKAEQIIHAEQPYTFLLRRKTLAFVDKRIHNLTNTKLGLNLAFVPLETFVPALQQKYAD